MIDKILSFIPPQILLLAIGASCALAAVFFYLYQSEVSDHAAYRTEVAAANAKVAETNRIRDEQAQQNTHEVAAAYVRYADDIVRERNSRIAGLQHAADHCATMQLVAKSAAVPDGNAEDDRPHPQTLEAVCEQLEADCTDTTGKLIYLQSWVRRVCK